jgi:hypothetical protein
MLLFGLPLSVFLRERYFEVFCTDAEGTTAAVVVPEWLALPQLHSAALHLRGHDLVNFGIREMVRAPFGAEWERRSKVWRLVTY